MIVIQPFIFWKFATIGFGFSTKKGLHRKSPYDFNLSFNVGDDPEIVTENRKTFFNYLKINENSIASQKQVHGDVIKIINNAGNHGESDAMITTEKNVALAISSADCCAIFIYDCKKEIIAAVHSGWRGTSNKILYKSLEKLKSEFGCNTEDFYCYISPSISQQNYEVGNDVADQFQKRYIKRTGDKYLLDIKSANYDMLIEQGVKSNQIQVSQLCSFGYSSLLHSYRRDGKNSGRAMGIIFMKGEN